jgi:hypothetical protein
VWNDDLKYNYINALQSDEITMQLDAMVEVIRSNASSGAHVDNTVSMFAAALYRAADPLFRKSISKRKYCVTKRAGPEWADSEWFVKKKDFYRNMDRYKKYKDETSRLAMVESRKQFKNKSRQCKRNFDVNKTNILMNAKYNNIKDYWKLLQGGKPKLNTVLTVDDFAEYFKRISNPVDDFYRADVEITNHVQEVLHSDLLTFFHELDAPLSYDDISKAIKRLKRGKSAGEDLIINELLIAGHDQLMPYIYELFNFVFDKGVFPDIWADGLLIPLHKSGSVNITNHFRGITLLPVLGKLFTGILSNRLDSWAERNRIYIEGQNGFRRGRGTVDSIFILSQAIQQYIQKGKRLYTMFVDFQKAFDYIVHDNLWFKLINVGIEGKMLRIITSMYRHVKSKVFMNGAKSEAFRVNLGVRQGECLSPFLFAMYVNDLEKDIEVAAAGITINHLKLFLLLYADDAVIFAETAALLQKAIDQLLNYCSTWKLKLNTDKSKVLVFKRGRDVKHERWFYGDNEIQKTNQIKYLGIMFTANGQFNLAQKTLADQANKAVFTLYKKLNAFPTISTSEQINLFDKLITPILSYAAPVWGFHPAPHIERIHLKYCKRLLGVKTTTQNDMVYGILGRYPLHTMRVLSVIKYWISIVHGMKSTLVGLCYENGRNALTENNTEGWVKSVRDILLSCGLGEAWYNQGVGNTELFIYILRNRLFDIYRQTWYNNLAESSKARFYRVVVNSHGLSYYLNNVTVKTHRISFSRLLLSSHRLSIESGRWNRPITPACNRYCPFCPNSIEDEYHFIIECRLYTDLRRKLIPIYYTRNASMAKLTSLFQSDNPNIIRRLAKFISKSFNIRDSSLVI